MIEKNIIVSSTNDDGSKRIHLIGDELIKTASYSAAILDFVRKMDRVEGKYYAVVNSVGSFEKWGANRNSDAFTKSGLDHESTNADANTLNDYGYKTFERYAKFYRNHVNKDPKKSYGDVLFAWWNEAMERVELVVALDMKTAKDIIDDNEAGKDVAVSMGCRVRYDRCSICGNKAKKITEYCSHLKNHLGKIVDHDTAATWSRELGITVTPGAQVFAFNDYPKFFDISFVTIGADMNAFFLGSISKDEASLIPEKKKSTVVMDFPKSGMTKVAGFMKSADIDKNVESTFSLSPVQLENVCDHLESSMCEINKNEPDLSLNAIEALSKLSTKDLIATMNHFGFIPKPHEFQKIVIMSVGRPDMAKSLHNRGVIFGPSDCSDDVVPITDGVVRTNIAGHLNLPMRSNNIEHMLGRSSVVEALVNALTNMNNTCVAPEIVKEASFNSTKEEKGILNNIGKLYSSLVLGASNSQVSKSIIVKGALPVASTIVSGAILFHLSNMMSKQNIAEQKVFMKPLREYRGALQDTDFTGIMKYAGAIEHGLGNALITGAIALPAAKVISEQNKISKSNRGKEVFNGANLINPATAVALAGGVGVGKFLSKSPDSRKFASDKVKELFTKK